MYSRPLYELLVVNTFFSYFIYMTILGSQAAYMYVLYIYAPPYIFEQFLLSVFKGTAAYDFFLVLNGLLILISTTFYTAFDIFK
jgi:hypothetical protein